MAIYRTLHKVQTNRHYNISPCGESTAKTDKLRTVGPDSPLHEWRNTDGPKDTGPVVFPVDHKRIP